MKGHNENRNKKKFIYGLFKRMNNVRGITCFTKRGKYSGSNGLFGTIMEKLWIFEP